MQTQETSIEKAKTLIENQLGWGESENWTNQDFHALSELILVRTGCQLSTVTLKRIWGRIKYNSVPSTSTLDILVNFAGYVNWRDFKVNHSITAPAITSAEKIGIEELVTSSSRYQVLYKPCFFQRGLWLTLVVVLQYSFILYLGRTLAVIPQDHSLSQIELVKEKVRQSTRMDRDFYKDSIDTISNQQYRKQSLSQRVLRVKPKPRWLLQVDAYGKHIILDPRS